MHRQVSSWGRGRSVALVATALAFAGIAAPALPTPASPVPDDVAPALRPWIPWVLHGHEVEACPLLASAQEPLQRVCAWPGRLELSLDGKGGQFLQRVRVWAEQAVALPGDEKRWPQEVTVDGRAAALVAQSDRPSVRLSAGEHAIRGAFHWDSLPEALPVPAQTGLLALTVRGRAVAYPIRDEAGVVWLERRADQADTEQVLDLAVHRKVVDDVPLLLVTRVELRVAGKNREELLGRALPAGFVPMSLSSPLPARLEADGQLRVQVRPGNFAVEIVARHRGPVQTLPRPVAAGPWPEEEVWAFEARPHLRRVVVEGVAPLDPQQTTLPEEWKSLPVYRVGPGETLVLSEKQRGDADPAPDQVALSRMLWLDMDGRGFSFRDQVTGTLSRSRRLAMPPPSELGYVSVAGQDVLITRLAAGEPPGVEASLGQLQLVAEGRIEGPWRTIPAVGWATDFQSAAAVLQLPPGWRILAAQGADDVPGTWLRTWDLLDLFLLLVTALAAARLLGWWAGLLALLTLALVIPEPHAPRWAWLVVLACEALVRLLPEGRWRQALRAARLASLAGLALLALVFAVGQLRVGLHPELERPEQPLAEPGFGGGLEMDQVPRLAPPAQTEKAAALPEESRSLALGRSKSDSPPTPAPVPELNQYRYQYDAKAAVQTGQGLPRWGWQSVPVRWSGPVEHGQQLTLWLVSPSWNLVLALARVLLVALWLLALSGLPGRFWTDGLRRLLSRRAATALLLAALVAPAARAQEDGADEPAAPEESAAAEESAAPEGPVEPEGPVAPKGLGPPRALLDELRQRLLEPPRCLPACASISRLWLEVRPGWLRARLEVHAQTQTGVPLPGDPRNFVPRQVRVGTEPAVLRRGGDGVLWALVPAGIHTVLLEGPLPPTEIVTLALPMRPHRVEARAQGYVVAGIQEDGLADDSLQLTRAGPQHGSAAALAPGQFPPFVRVERTLALGLTWQATTRVVRLTPPGAAVVLEVPLLPGEQVITPGVRVVDGRALVHLAAQAGGAEWRSALPIRDTLRLQATAPELVESWQLDASPIWHVSWSGIATVHAADPDPGRQVPEWRPWPGETVTLAVSRPEAVPGPTLTINQSQLEARPGLRSSDFTLTLLARASRGGQHSIRLPPGAEVQSVSIRGQVQPVRMEGEELPLPIVPGEQEVQVTWRQPLRMTSLFQIPVVNLGLPSVNADLRLEVPLQRWVLWAGGAPAGPAVLFWNLLAVLLLVAAGLARLGWAPLRWWSWLLLAVGLTQVPVLAAVVPVAWLLLLEWRRRAPPASRRGFNLLQVGLVGLTLAALGVLFVSIEQGLLGLPDMQVQGNGSSAHLLRWFADRSGPALPRPWLFSVPLLVYRGLMLAWALWIAWSLLAWLRWGWECFTTGGGWRPAPRKVAPPAAPG